MVDKELFVYKLPGSPKNIGLKQLFTSEQLISKEKKRSYHQSGDIAKGHH